jgi:glucoamylase
LAAGRDPKIYIKALEAFADPTGLLAEQIWDQPDSPDGRMKFGRPTGAAMPLMWAHAEYIKLLRSVKEGQVFDLIPAVADRYLKQRNCRPLEIWKINRQPRFIAAGMTLRVQAAVGFVLRWTNDEWQEVHDSPSTPTEVEIAFVDIDVPKEQRAPLRFTFYWPQEDRWEGRDFQVAVTNY